MAQKRLHDGKRSSVLEQKGRVAVAQTVWRYRALKPRSLARLGDDPPQSVAG